MSSMRTFCLRDGFVQPNELDLLLLLHYENQAIDFYQQTRAGYLYWSAHNGRVGSRNFRLVKELLDDVLPPRITVTKRSRSLRKDNPSLSARSLIPQRRKAPSIIVPDRSAPNAIAVQLRTACPH